MSWSTTRFSSWYRYLQEERLNLKDPEPQVIVDAIAAFAVNNKVWVASLNLTPVAAATFPAITMAPT